MGHRYEEEMGEDSFLNTQYRLLRLSVPQERCPHIHLLNKTTKSKAPAISETQSRGLEIIIGPLCSTQYTIKGSSIKADNLVSK